MFKVKNKDIRTTSATTYTCISHFFQALTKHVENI